MTDVKQKNCPKTDIINPREDLQIKTKKPISLKTKTQYNIISNKENENFIQVPIKKRKINEKVF